MYGWWCDVRTRSNRDLCIRVSADREVDERDSGRPGRITGWVVRAVTAARRDEMHIPQSLVRFRRQVHVKPTKLLVITPDHDIVSTRVDIQTTDPLETRLQRLEQLLACQIVQTDITLGSREKVRLGRVKGDALDGPLRLFEGRLRLMFRELVDEDGFVGSCCSVSVRSNACGSNSPSTATVEK
jgi:hypothetical protein